MSKFVISVVSDISDSSTYGIFDTEEEAEKVLEQLPEHMYEGDYFFNIHEIQTKDDFLDSYAEDVEDDTENFYDDEFDENVDVESDLNNSIEDFRERIVAVADKDAANWTSEDFIRESQKSANDFLYGDKDAADKTLDEIFADDENVSESDFDEHYERKYLRAQYSYVMLNNIMVIPENGSFRSDEQIGKVSRKMVKEFRKDYQNKVRELVEEKGIPLDQLFDEEFLY